MTLSKIVSAYKATVGRDSNKEYSVFKAAVLFISIPRYFINTILSISS
jgi:hypothetical protein